MQTQQHYKAFHGLSKNRLLEIVKSLPDNQLYEIKMKSKSLGDDFENEADMPPEDQIRPEFVKMVEESQKDIREGRFVVCKTKEESDALFDSIWNEDE